MARDVKKRGAPSYTNKRNRAKSMRRKADKKKMCRSSLNAIKENWEYGKTPRENIQDMGIAFDPNEVIPIKKTRREVVDAVPIDGEEVHVPVPVKKVTRKKKDVVKAADVVQKIEENANECAEKQSQQNRKHRLFNRETELCIYMLARHGEDFQAMTRDPKNLWQYTPKQWAKKIRIHKESAMHKFMEGV